MFSGFGLYASDVHVHLHILFLIQDWDARVLFIDTKANKFCQLTNDMLVSVLFFMFSNVS